MKSLTTKTSDAIEKLAQGQPKDSVNQIIDIREYDVPFGANSSRGSQIRRCFVSTVDSGALADVGWVINDSDIRICLICQVTFGMLHWKHHCRACGNLICQNCSKYTSYIKTVEPLGAVKVCSECFKPDVSFIL